MRFVIQRRQKNNPNVVSYVSYLGYSTASYQHAGTVFDSMAGASNALAFYGVRNPESVSNHSFEIMTLTERLETIS